MKMQETQIKYLAGLMDADGSLSFTYNNGYLHLVLNLELAESIDRNGKFIKSLQQYGGKLYTRKREENWSRTNTWRVQKRSELEMLLPRLIKHMVIKGRYWSWLLQEYRDNRAIPIDGSEYSQYVTEAQERRKETGPVKAKLHPTWAWLAGYLDGDGHYLLRKRSKQTELRVGAVCAEYDKQVLEFIQKHLGGQVRQDKEGYYRWNRNLGPRDRSFALKFLRKMVQHSQMKTWKIEQLIAFHSQRLTISSPKGCVIV